MSQMPSPWAWVGRAIAIAVVMTVGGWGLGLLGALYRPMVAGLLGFGLFVVGGGMAAARIGAAGVAASLIGLVAAGLTASAGHRVMVATRAPIVELASLSQWDPHSRAVALHVGDLQLLHNYAGWVQRSSGSGKTFTTIDQVVTPILDPKEQRIVAFHCRSTKDDEPHDGRWVLASAALLGHEPSPVCTAGLELALQHCAKANIAVAPGAEARSVEVYATERELRSTAPLRLAAGIPLGFLTVYAVLVVLFRKNGSRRA